MDGLNYTTVMVLTTVVTVMELAGLLEYYLTVIRLLERCAPI